MKDNDTRPDAGTPDSLAFLFDPSSVAIIGASDDPGRIGGRPLRYLKQGGFKGPIYPVNPTRTTVQGLKAYADIAAVPGEVDLAIIALPAASVISAVRGCAGRGVKAVIVFSSGFAEADAAGAALQAEITATARAAGMRMLGPNCLGAFNSRAGFFGTFSNALDSRLPEPGCVAIASQSGAIGAHLAYLCADRKIGIGYWITTGNEGDIDLSAALLWLAQAPDVKVIIVYAEAIRDGAAFVRALDLARRSRKPIVMLKVGRSIIGARAAASHTGALAGQDAVYDAVLRQYGVWRAASIEQMLDIAYACLAGKYPVNRSIGLVTGSGGVGIQMADAADRLGLNVAPMPADAQAQIKALIPFASPVNPVDTTGQVVNDSSLFERCLDVTIGQGGYESFLIFLASGPATPSMCIWLLASLNSLRTRYPERLIVLSMTAPAEVVRKFEQAGFLVFEDTDRALIAVAALCRFGESFLHGAAGQIARDDFAQPQALPAVLNEHTAKKILGGAGISIWPETFARDVGEVRAAAAAFAAKVAIKIVSPTILHKSEAGGVALAIRAEDAESTAQHMLERIGREHPEAQIDGFLVSPMCEGGVETICGTIRDPVFGPVVMFGLGGVFVEVLGDVTFRMAPIALAEAKAMIDEVRGRKMLAGVRGQPAVDVEALARALVDLSKFAYRYREQVSEIDINPLRVMEKGAVALDALITRG